jgi:general secretion pathway protein K
VAAALRSRRNPAKNNRGVAMLMAVSAVALITYLAMEVMYDSTVEYTVNAQALNRLKAYYAAKSGMDVGLLRVKIYQSVVKRTKGKDLGPFGAMIDQIWQFPFAWPMPVPEDMNTVDKDMAQKIVKDSIFDGTFSLSIQDEGSKIDLSDLISESKTLREITQKRLVEIFSSKVETDDEWRAKYGNYRFDELINNIADWMSPKNESLNGGTKGDGYSDLNQGRQYFPPNRGFRTLQEMRMVKDMNDEFFDVLSPRVTIYGMRGVNPNIASEEILMSISPGITKEVVAKIMERRNDKNSPPFAKAEDFWSFVEGLSEARFRDQEHKKVPLSFATLVTFRISSIGEYSGSAREIIAVVTDIDTTAERIKEFIEKDKKDDDPNYKPPPAPANPPAKNLPKGPPRIVYWSER